MPKEGELIAGIQREHWGVKKREKSGTTANLRRMCKEQRLESHSKTFSRQSAQGWRNQDRLATYGRCIMAHRDYDHYSRTKAHRLYPARSTRFLLHVLQMCQARLGYSEGLENPLPMSQASATVVSQRVRKQAPVPVVREQR